MGLFGGHLNSIQGIFALDPVTKNIVQEAFRRACRWSFYSLIPWCSVAALLCLGLSKLPDEVATQGWTYKGGPQGSQAQTTGVGPVVGDDEKEKSAGGETRPQAPSLAPNPTAVENTPEQPSPWRAVPAPRGPVTLLIYPIRVAIAALRQRRG